MIHECRNPFLILTLRYREDAFFIRRNSNFETNNMPKGQVHAVATMLKRPGAGGSKVNLLNQWINLDNEYIYFSQYANLPQNMSRTSYSFNNKVR
jgi:hypothetical protein